jgi:hypothetical protein
MEQKTCIQLADILSTFISFVYVGVQVDVGDEAVENRTGCLNHAINRIPGSPEALIHQRYRKVGDAVVLQYG